MKEDRCKPLLIVLLVLASLQATNRYAFAAAGHFQTPVQTRAQTRAQTPAQTKAPSAPDSTTVILVRHAEKAKLPAGDPALSTEGTQRATELLQVLQSTEIDALWACDHRRTVETLQPLANRHKLRIRDKLTKIENRIGDADSPLVGEALGYTLRKRLKKHRGGTVVIASHSNITPRLVNSLTSTELTDLPEWQYDNLYIVTLHRDGRTELEQRKYGKESVAEDEH